MPDAVEHYRSAPSKAQISSNHQQEILEEYLARAFGSKLTPLALDLGSGRGSNITTISRYAEHIVAADVALDALVESRQHHDDLGRRLAMVLLPGTGLPFASESLALSVCTEVLEHVDDLAATAAELERVTVSGGYLAISTPNYRNIMGLIKKWKDWRSGRQDFDPWGAHAGGFERFITAPQLRATFPGCDLI